MIFLIYQLIFLLSFLAMQKASILNYLSSFFLQPRDTCYVASEGLTELKYSGYQPHAYSWDDYPVLKDILKAVSALPHAAVAGGIQSIIDSYCN